MQMLRHHRLVPCAALRRQAVVCKQAVAPAARRHLRRVVVRAAASAAPAVVAAPLPAISLTDAALTHLKKLRDDSKGKGATSELLLRVGVKQGGCSGMSYSMDFTDAINEEDHVMTYGEEEGRPFRLVIDPKSLLYLFGLRLDYSSELIGGGFKFSNPNSTESCGCGKSFSV